MLRLDVRVKTQLPAEVFYVQKGHNFFRGNVTISELSVSGALIDSLCPESQGVITLRPKLSEHGELELFGDIVRITSEGAAIKFYYPDRKTILKLWDHIKENISDSDKDMCSYCGQINYGLEYCRKCGWYLNFKDKAYLDKHVEETFMERLKNHDSLSPEQVHRILNLMDTELLKERDKFVDEEFVGTCGSMLEVFSMIRKVATTDINVLIAGESGTGKELTAKAIHERSKRRDKPFVVINCAAIPDSLLESELFGYERGAFTGAYISKKGKFEHADGGTLFLDEIGDLSPGLQAKLLRFLEDRIVERIGGKGGKKVDVRVIAATNRDINEAVQKGGFRRDLYFRLNAFTIELPPLRERGDDKVILAKYFLHKFSKEMRLTKDFTDDALDAIRDYDWPGNVREVINKVRRAIVMSKDNHITMKDLNLSDVATSKSVSFKKIKGGIEKQRLIEVLNLCNYNISTAAKTLGVSRQTVYNLKKRYGIFLYQK